MSTGNKGGEAKGETKTIRTSVDILRVTRLLDFSDLMLQIVAGQSFRSREYKGCEISGVFLDIRSWIVPWIE